MYCTVFVPPEVGVSAPAPVSGVPVPDKVIVPDVGEKVALDPIDKTAATVYEVLAVTVAEALMVKLLKVSAVPELTIEEPLFIVIVPPDGANVTPEPLVRTPLTEKDVLYCA